MKLGVILDVVSGRLKQHTAEFFDTSDAAVSPTAGKLVKSDSYGKIVADWISGVLSIAQLPVATSGEVSSTKVVRADDSRLVNPSLGGDLSGTSGSATVIKIQGRSVASTSPSDGQLLGYNNTLARWEPVNPSSGGSSLTVQEIDGSPIVADVSTLRVPNGSLSNDGGGTVTISLSGSGGSDPGGLLYLFSMFK